MTTTSPSASTGSTAPNPYGGPQEPMSKSELKRQKRMQKASRGWFARHKFLTALLVLIAIVVIAVAVSGGDDENDSDAGSAPTSTSSDTGAATAGLGDAVEAGAFTITVASAEPGITSIGDQNFGAQPQGQFVQVDVSVTNTGNSAEYFFESDAVLVDTQGREHSSSSDSIYLEDDSLFISEINPGNTASGAILFDIPADAEIELLRISPGMFSEDVDVALR